MWFDKTFGNIKISKFSRRVWRRADEALRKQTSTNRHVDARALVSSLGGFALPPGEKLGRLSTFNAFSVGPSTLTRFGPLRATYTWACWRRPRPAEPGWGRRSGPSELRCRSREDSPRRWCPTCWWLPEVSSPTTSRCVRTGPCRRDNKGWWDKRSLLPFGVPASTFVDGDKPSNLHFRWPIFVVFLRPSESPEAVSTSQDAKTKGSDCVTHIHVCLLENTEQTPCFYTQLPVGNFIIKGKGLSSLEFSTMSVVSKL